MPAPANYKRCIACRDLVGHSTLTEGLFCSPACRDKYAADHLAIGKQLTEAGFSQHPDTPNMWLKQDVAITAEEVRNHGITKVLERHARAIASVNPAPSK